ncbi:MAG TPA: YraN family protein [Candidatus Saccharimonadales bacterium]|nr:YraN family protein [Candidatus Saccharimonadales bacterium]
MTNFAHGREAEAAAAKYLENLGYTIHAQNWRTRQCEIDIVAKKNKTIYCVEVKYRQNAAQGRGLDYITPKKLQQMQFAAEVWASQNRWQSDICLAAIELSGPAYEIETFIDSIT